MKNELDEALVAKYPKIFKYRHAPMTHTAMCWGFECGDGWFNILDQLMSNIQHHIDWKEKQRNWAVTFNSKAKPEEFREVHELIPQVTLDQVKEKLGTLRFYYTGGDEYIRGMVTMAEAMSGTTCETCGNVGKFRGKSWFYTSCDEHNLKGE